MSRTIIIGTRGSELALWQAHYTRDRLSALGHSVELKIIKTQGDRIQHLSFDKMEGKGFFTKELEEALLSGEIDLAVHSHKDLPTENPSGLVIAGVSYREDCSESLLIRPEALDETRLLSLKQQVITGTSSHRRKSQLLHLRPDLRISELRGNVPTRIEKLRQGQYDAVLLATAGLNRLQAGLDDFIRIILPPVELIPAPAQGVLAFQVRENDLEMQQIISQISDPEVQETILAERTVLNRLEGGCLLPLGAYCEKKANGFRFWASLQPLDGRPFRRIFIEGSDPLGIARHAVMVLNRNENKTVYISRDPADAIRFTQQVNDYGYRVIARSPITFETIEAGYMPLTDWIFFTSRKAVEHFFDQELIVPVHTRVAALGSGTAAVLKETGITPDFTGDDGDTRETALKFAGQAAGKSVLFPVAEQGLRTVQKTIADRIELHELPIYRTIEQPLPETITADIYVFTSPSAVYSYMRQQPLPGGKIIAIGHSTAAALKEAGCSDVQIAPYTNEQALGDCVCGS